MAIFSLLITKAPFDSQSAYTAFRFAESALSQGHEVNGVFFYQSGVNNGNSFQTTHSDEVNLYHKWTKLSQQHNVPLQVCVTAANRRGIINADDAAEKDQSFYNLTPPFSEVGLGDLVALMNSADRTIQF